MNWKKAYLKQAKSDYMMFKELRKTKKPLCHQLHYLQMFTEKLAKSYLCPAGNSPPKTTHFMLVKLLRLCKRTPNIRNKVGFKNKHASFGKYIDNLIPLADEIEKLAPAGTQLNRANPEYPWIADGEIIAPVDYSFKNLSMNGRTMATFLRLIHKLIEVS